MTDIEQAKIEILNCIRHAVSQHEQTIFLKLTDLFLEYWNRPCSSMLELRKRTTKQKGFLFEVFCKMYLEQKGYTVWLLQECPDNILEDLALTKHDVGIDLIACITTKHKNSQTLWFPIQCKFRAESNKNGISQTLGWKQVSTFLSLCTRTGPILKNDDSDNTTKKTKKVRGWAKHIIMTNCKNVRWQGRKTKLDWTIAQESFKKPLRTFWASWLSESPIKHIEKNKVSDLSEEPPSQLSARERRQKWLDNLESNRSE